MKYLIINGSPHKGNTWALVLKVRQEILSCESHATFKEIHLINENLPFCCGCSNCFRLGEKYCPHFKITEKIMSEIQSSDGIIVASATYNRKETALLKNLFDHFSFLLHRPRFFNKKAFIITSTGGVGSKSASSSISSFLTGIGFNKCYRLSVSTYSWNNYKPLLKTELLLKHLTLKFHQDILANKKYPVKLKQVIPYNLFRGMSIFYIKGSPYETEDGVFWTDSFRKKSVYDKDIPISTYLYFIGILFFHLGKLIGKNVIITYKKGE